MTELKSRIYTGWVRHRRFTPRFHGFRYRVFMMYLSLDELDRVCSLSPFWSMNKWNLAQFRRKDFHGPENVDLKQAVLDTVFRKTGERPDGDIFMLVNLCYFGYTINPLSTYYCFDKNNRLHTVLAEVTNTPWAERHAYVLRCNPHQQKQRFEFAKAFHVSPFNDLDMNYHWYSNLPNKNLYIQLENWRQGEKIMDATLTLKENPVAGSELNWILVRFPFMTVKVAVAIYWQALKLWWRKVAYVPHPKNHAVSSAAYAKSRGNIQ